MEHRGRGAGPPRSKVFFQLRREKAKILASTSDLVEANEKLAERFGTSSDKIALEARAKQKIKRHLPTWAGQLGSVAA